MSSEVPSTRGEGGTHSQLILIILLFHNFSFLFPVYLVAVVTAAVHILLMTDNTVIMSANSPGHTLVLQWLYFIFVWLSLFIINGIHIDQI